MASYTATKPVLHDGVRYEPGQVIEFVGDAPENLVRSGAVEPAKAAAEPAKPAKKDASQAKGGKAGAKE